MTPGIADEVAVRELSGVQKAALVLINMSTERAAAVLRNFAEDEAVEIAQEMARLKSTGGRAAELAIREFREQADSPAVSTATGAVPTMAAVTTLIQASFEPEQAEKMLERIELTETSASFAFLDEVPPADIVRLLERETAEAAAFVLVQLGPDLAAKVLMAQDATRRIDVAQCVATMGTPVPEAGGIVADALKAGLRRAAASPLAVADDEGGDGAPAPALHVQALVDIMNHAEPAAEGELIAGLMDRDSALAAEVRSRLLSFEDVPKLQDRDLQQVLRAVDIATIALALKGADAEIGDAMRANMSERNRETLAEETAELGRVAKSRVEEARNSVVRAIRELAGTTGLELKKAPAEPGAEPEDAEAAQDVDEEEYVD